MAPKAEIINRKKTVTVLVFNTLSLNLGLSPSLEWHDVYSLTEPCPLSLIPRPFLALLVIIPLTPSWKTDRLAEEASIPAIYRGKGPGEPVLWFKQTIGHACGSIGLVHCLLNGPASAHLLPSSFLSVTKAKAMDLDMEARAKLLYDSQEFEHAHQSVAEIGDSKMPTLAAEGHEGQHFVAFVKEDGRLWELEGGRRGPLDRGLLKDHEDVLSPKAVKLGIGRVIELERASGGGDLTFSCIALAKKVDE